MVSALAQAVNVPALDVDLPTSPRSWEASDSALVEAVRGTGGRVFVGLKAPGAPRTREQARMNPDQMASPGRVVLQGRRAALTADAARAGIQEMARVGAEIVRYYENLGVAYVTLASAGLVLALRANPVVDYVEPDDAVIHLAAGAPVLRGPYRAREALAFASGVMRASSYMSGQTIPWGVALVRAPDAWAYSTGSNSKMLIIDTGHERGHADLPLVPLAQCFGFFGGCDDPVQTSSTLPHGSHVTGIAVALDNGVGVVGVAKGLPASNLYQAGACDANIPFPCSTNEIVSALNWSVSGLGPRGVINMSLGGTTNPQSQAVALAAAFNAGHVLVAAMGNQASNVPFYPAANTNVIAVGAVLPDKGFAYTLAPCSGTGGSNWGAHVDFVAPWYALSTVPNSTYADETSGWCGTSMATPHVSALVALLRTRYPAMDASSIYFRLRDTAEPLGPVGWDDHYGFGLIRSHLAVAFERPVVVPAIVNGRPRLSWPAVPFATEYRIYRRVTPSACPQWVHWGTRTTTNYTDTSTPVASFHGFDTNPAPSVAVSYYVTAFAEGVETVYYQFLTYLPSSAPVC